MPARKFTYVSLFAGCGGFDHGFKLAGFRCVAACDADDAPLEVHRQNLGCPTHKRDLSEGIPRSLIPGDIDVIVAGPPCQGFSTAGKRDPDDPRNHLLTVPALVAAKFSAKVVVVENVMGVLAGKHRQHWDKLKSMLAALNYRTREIKCNAVEHGVPQERRRLVLIAWSNGIELEGEISAATGGVLGDVLQNLHGVPNHNPKPLPFGTAAHVLARHIRPGQKLCNVRAGERSVHTWHIPTVFGRTTEKERQVLVILSRLRRRSRLRDFGDADPVTATAISGELGEAVESILGSLAKKGYVRRLGRRYDLAHTFNGKYRRLCTDKPSPTVDTRFGDPRYFLHPIEDRGFTVREAARLQGFPDTFVFCGAIAAQYRMIGNAVPPPLASRIAEFVRQAILLK